jgi:hypothetical protein
MRIRSFLPTTVLASGLALQAACTGDILANITEEQAGNITIQFINNTPFRASLTAGGYDDLNRNPPGAVQLQQQAVEGRDSSAVLTLSCPRDLAVGTDGLVQRILDTDADQGANFNNDLFSAQVNFSSAPADSDAANQPTEGFAEGIVVRLGNDFACEDRILFIFEVDAEQPGGFRIDVEVIEDQFGDE